VIVIRKRSRKIYYILLIIITILSLIYSIRGKYGILKIIELKHEIADIKNDTEKINKENEYFQMRIEALKTDRKTVESVAREELGMVREDEVLLLFKNR
jgi:cell division protein FtsB